MSRINDIWQRKPAGLVLGLDFSGERVTSPTGHSGVFVGSATVAAGTRYLSGLGAGGSSLNIADDPVLSFTNGSGQDLPFTLMAWYKPTTLQNNYNDLIYKGEYFLRVGLPGTAGRVGVAAQNSALTALVGRETSGTVLSAGVWSLVTGTYSGAETNASFKIYVNLTQVDNTNSGYGAFTGMSDTVYAVSIGGTAYSGANGIIAGVRIYNRVLTAAEIAQIYNAGAARIALGGTP